MKRHLKNLITVSMVTTVTISLAQETKTYNPYEGIGKQAEVLTLSDGQYDEFFDTDTIEIIGSAILNTNTMKVIGFIEYDTIYSEATMKAEVVSRWLSPDPLAAKYPEDSPYMFSGNSPIIMKDGDGREKIVVSGHPGGHGNYKHFLLNGLSRAKALKQKAGSEQVTWLIYQSSDPDDEGITYTGAQLKSYIKQAKAAGIKVAVVDKVETLNDYVNYKTGGMSRDKDLVTDFVYVGHADDDELLPAYKGSDSDWDLDAWQKGAFSDKSNANLCAACNTANSNLFIDNPAEDAAEKVGGNVKGSTGTVHFPGGAISDKTLQFDYETGKKVSEIKTIKGSGGTSKQTKSEKAKRESKRPQKTSVSFR